MEGRDSFFFFFFGFIIWVWQEGSKPGLQVRKGKLVSSSQVYNEHYCIYKEIPHNLAYKAIVNLIGGGAKVGQEHF